MPEIIQCPDCNQETYRGLAECPHCNSAMPPHLSKGAKPLTAGNVLTPRRLVVVLVFVAAGLLFKFVFLAG